MKVQDALTPAQLRRLRQLGGEDRTPARELLNIARALEQYLHDRGELARFRREDLSEERLAADVQLRRRIAQQETLTRLDETRVATGSVIYTSRQSVEEGDPTSDAVLDREELADKAGIAGKRLSRVSGWRDYQGTHVPSALVWAHRWLRPWIHPIVPTPDDAAYIQRLAIMLNTTERKLIETYNLADEVLDRVEDTLWRTVGDLEKKPAYLQLADKLSASFPERRKAANPGQDVYARRSRHVSTETSAEPSRSTSRRSGVYHGRTSLIRSRSRRWRKRSSVTQVSRSVRFGARAERRGSSRRDAGSSSP
jgi:hypothetical protein